MLFASIIDGIARAKSLASGRNPTPLPPPPNIKYGSEYVNWGEEDLGGGGAFVLGEGINSGHQPKPYATKP